MSHVEDELNSQPECWIRAAEEAGWHGGALPAPGERVAIVGCGTSYFMAQAVAALREAAGQGESDAFAASEFPPGRSYDRVVALTRSGTTTEVLELLARLRGGTRTTAITADPATPVTSAADDLVVLDFADERSVVQTRFATTALTLLRAHLGL
ncbi:SIS domain-containing protein, partial [Streptomyces sp. SAS_269]|uniref:SIS domain-containing protein n=1 Tax=Streptomyces sp. SAS_269 TaxID=3412749 RepID=UPI00403CD50A